MTRVAFPDRPYPGLRPFQKNEWPIFFGRKSMVDAVLDMLAKRQLVVVHGSSGCGKSSLIKAGVLPRLEQDHARYGVIWQTAQMRPGAAPLWNLAEAFARVVENLPDDELPTVKTTRKIRRLLDQGTSGLHEINAQFEVFRDGNVCILLDQFEEIFRYAQEFGRAEVETFVDVLRAFADNPPEGMHVIVTMRSDHLGDCAHFTGFAELVNQSQYLLPRMSDEDLHLAIREPAQLFGGDVTEELALRLIQDTRGEVDGLPLVQHCLMQLWQNDEGTESHEPASKSGAHAPRGSTGSRKSGPILSPKYYVGLQKMLSDHADEILSELAGGSSSVEHIVEHLFRGISEVDGDGRGIRRPRRLSELVGLTGDNPDQLDAVIDRFIDQNCGFLFRSNDTDPVIDISHEALIRCWEPLSSSRTSNGVPLGWLHKEVHDGQVWTSLLFQAGDGTVLPQHLVEERRKWMNSLPGATWAERYGGGWDAVEDLIARSEQALASRHKRDRWIRGGLVAACVVFCVLAGMAWISQRDAVQATKVAMDAERRALTAFTHQWNSTRALAKQTNRSRVSTNTLEKLVALEFLPDGASSIPDRAEFPRISEIEKHLKSRVGVARKASVTMRGPNGAVVAVALAPDGKHAATGAGDGTIRIWDTTTGGLIKALPVNEKSTNRLLFSPDGATLLIGTRTGKTRLLDIATGEWRDPPGEVGSTGHIISWSPNGKRFAGASTDPKNTSVFIANARTGKVLQTFAGLRDVSKHAYFSPDSSQLLTMDRRRVIQVWSVSTGKQAMKFNPRYVTNASWLPDGQSIAITDQYRRLSIYSAKSGEKISTTPRQRAGYYAPGSVGLRILTKSSGEISTVRNVKTNAVEFSLLNATETIRSSVWSKDGTQVMIGFGDGTARLWKLGQPRPDRPDADTLQIYIESAKLSVDRCFSEKERSKLRLRGGVPAWCLNMKKPPFDAKGRIASGVALLRKRPNPKKTASTLSDADEFFKIALSLDAERAPEIRQHKINYGLSHGVTLFRTAISNTEKYPEHQKGAKAFFDYALAQDGSANADIKDSKAEIYVEAGYRILGRKRRALQNPTDEKVNAREQAREQAEQFLKNAANLSVYGGRLAMAARAKAAKARGDIRLAKLLSLELLDLQQVLPIHRAKAPLRSKPSARRRATARGRTAAQIWRRYDPLKTLTDTVLPEMIHATVKGRFSDVYMRDNGKRIVAVSGNGGITIWNAKSGEKITSLRPPRGSVPLHVHPSGTQLVASPPGKSVHFWSANEQRSVDELKSESAKLVRIRWSPDGRTFAAIGSERTSASDRTGKRAYIWNVTDRKLLRSFKFDSPVTALAFSPNGQKIAFGGSKGNVEIFRVMDGKSILKLKPESGRKESIYRVIWSPDGKKIVSTSRNMIRSWDTAHGKEIGTFIERYIQTGDFNPRTGQLAIGTTGSGQIYMWDLKGHSKDNKPKAILQPGLRLFENSNGNQSVILKRSGQISILDRILRDKDDLIHAAKETLDSCLTSKERKRFHLKKAMPDWCKNLGKNASR